ncbi:MAG: hypothetical protein ABF449_00545 [Ethanoligenens sp.]
MTVTINGIDSEQYNAILLNKDIQPATVIVYRDWMRQGLNPLNYGAKQNYKFIKLFFYIENISEDAVTDDISNLCVALESCTLKFSDLTKCYDSALADSSPISDTKIRPGAHQLDVTLQSSYAYLPPATIALTNQSQSITAQGNLPSPAIVTITPAQDMGSIVLTGLTKKPFMVSSLHANSPVVVDGESCTVTEPDLDTVMTADMGANMWMTRIYSMPNIFSPDTISTNHVPTKLDIPQNYAYRQQLNVDTVQPYYGMASNCLIHLKTGLYVAVAKSLTMSFLHDDGVNVYLNGTSIYSCSHAEDNNGNPGYPSVVLNLNAGWNIFEFLVLNHYGIGGVWGFGQSTKFRVDQLNAYYARDANPTGTVSKFPDCTIWGWPTVQPGTQTITTSELPSACSVSVQYKPKFM